MSRTTVLAAEAVGAAEGVWSLVQNDPSEFYRVHGGPEVFSMTLFEHPLQHRLFTSVFVEKLEASGKQIIIRKVIEHQIVM